MSTNEPVRALQRPTPERREDRRLDIQEALARFWMGKLADHDLRLLYRIIDQVSGFRASERVLSEELILHGRLANGEQVICSSGLSRRGYYRAKANLTALRLLECTPNPQGKGTVWRVLADNIIDQEVHYMRMKGSAQSQEPAALGDARSNDAAWECHGGTETETPANDEPREEALQECHTDTETVPPWHNDSATMAPINYDNKTTTNKPYRVRERPRTSEAQNFNPVGALQADVADAANVIRHIAANASAKRSETVERRAAASRAKPVSARRVGDLEAIWRAAHQSAFPHAPGVLPWTVRELAKVKNLMRGWPADRDMGAFFEFVVVNWRAICREKFSRLQNPPPERPSINFLIPMITNFEASFAEGGVKALARDKLPLLERLIADGRTREEALVEIGRREERAKGGPAQAPAQVQFRQRTATPPHAYGAHNPHPNSPNAQRRRAEAAMQATIQGGALVKPPERGDL